MAKVQYVEFGLVFVKAEHTAPKCSMFSFYHIELYQIENFQVIEDHHGELCLIAAFECHE